MDRILYLGPPAPLVQWLAEREKVVKHIEEPLELEQLQAYRPDWIISYNYQHILGRAVVEAYRGMIINLHIGYLPWNRGQHPNVWAWLEGSPQGVTIHQIDKGVDTGPILCQLRVPAHKDDTFRTSYERLQTWIQRLFKSRWLVIKSKEVTPRAQVSKGTLHRTKDLDAIWHLFSDGFDTPVMDVIDGYKQFGAVMAGKARC